MFVHHVFFWMKAGADTLLRAELAAGIQTLQSIELPHTFHIGIAADTYREVIDRSYDFSLLMIFNTAAEEQEYQQHPIHLQFIESCRHLWEKVVVYDSISL